MASMIYTSQRSNLSKKQRAIRDALIKEQREIKKGIRVLQQQQTSSVISSLHRSSSHNRIASLDTGVGNAIKKPVTMYTGDKMIGIGQMHKSNAVPIFKQEDAEDLAKMRR